MKFDLRQNRIKKYALLILLVALFLVVVCTTIFGAETYTKKHGVVTTSPGYTLNIRAEATSSSSRVSFLNSGDKVIVLGEVKGQYVNGSDIWYLIEANGVIGYVTSKYIEITGDVTTTPPSDTTQPGEGTTPPEGGEQPVPVDFEEYLTQQGFPESYKGYLRELHALYPNWVFKAHHTGLDFEYSVDCQMDRSLVENYFPSSWKSIEPGAYNWETNQWLIYDGDRWVRASRDIIKHYMDPRNFLGVNSVFQFLDQSYDPEVQTLEGVKRVIAGSFMEKDVIDTDGTTLNYATALFNAGTEYKVNPYVLASMVLIEVGNQGSSIITGTVPGYEGYFNYFNIGAYNDGIRGAVERGLWYAKGGNNGGTSYHRPWNTRLRALRGGAVFYADGYLSVGQNTLYLKRFNVQGDFPFTHQYMTSVYGPAVEATKLASGYTQELRNTPLSFYIPIYENMPETPCPQPTKDGSPNMKLTSLSVEGYTLTPEFAPDTLEYTLVVAPIISSINISAVKMESTATVEGTGVRTIGGSSNVFEIKVTAGNGTVRIYKITVAKENSGEYGDFVLTDYYGVNDSYVYNILPETTIGHLKTHFITKGVVKVTGEDGVEKADSDILKSGDTLSFFTSNGNDAGKYTAAVKGDLNRDGKVTVGDLIKIRNIILGVDETTDLYLLSGDLNGSDSINVSDLIRIRNHILGTTLITK